MRNSAFNGDYNSLSNKPVIPAAQVNSDWSSVSGVSQVLNKPTTVSGYGITDAVTATALSSALAGYVTTTSLATQLSGYATTASVSTLNAALTGKYNVPTGTTSQYIRGDGSIANFPTIPTAPVSSVNGKTGVVVLNNTDVGAAATNHTHSIAEVPGLQTALDAKASTSALTSATTGLKRVETFSRTSDASGNISITFANTYTSPPDVQPQIIGGTFNQMVRVVSVSNTGCVLQCAQRNLVTLLAIEVLLGATVPLSGANVSVLVTPR